MRRISFPGCLGLLAALVLVSGVPLEAQKVSPPRDLESRIDAYVAPYLKSRNFSGVILIARGDRVLLRKGYGMANYELGVANGPQTKFHIASLSKCFTAAAILLLEQRGQLSVHDPLAKFLPDYPNAHKITVHHLLIHTSGIPNVNSFPDYEEKSRSSHRLEEIIGWFKDRPLQFEPGARYSYSNSNYNLLAYMIEKTSGQGYGDFLRDNIFLPLGMKDTAHDGDPRPLTPGRAAGYAPAGADEIENAPFLDWSIKTGNGSLYTTVDDLYRWDRALYGDRPLNQETRTKMFTEHWEGVGYGWFLRRGKRRSVGIGGRSPGFSSSLERFTDDDVCVILLSNLYSSITHSMAPDIAAIVFGEDRQALVPPVAVPVPPAVLDSYVGRYQFGPDFVFNPNMVGDVERRGGWLVLMSGGGGGSSYLIPLSDERFLDRAYGGTVRFVKDSNGKVTQLTWTFGQDYSAVRVSPTQ